MTEVRDVTTQAWQATTLVLELVSGEQTLSDFNGFSPLGTLWGFLAGCLNPLLNPAFPG